MANTIQSPNMNMPLPVPGVDPGEDYANNQNASFLIADAHDHTAGKGVPVTPAGMNINADFPLNGNNLITARSARFTPQASALSGANDLGCAYVAGADLYYNDTAGNQVRITSGGTVNATSSGIASGSATASFVSSVLVVNQATNTPANIQAGSILFGNNTAGSNFVTVSAPSALGANYSLTWPQIPLNPAFVTIDTSGNLGTASSISGSQIASASLSGTQIENQTITQGLLALRATGSSVAAGGVATSFVSSYGTTSAGNPGFSCTIVTTGRPVCIGFYSGTGGGSWSANNTGSTIGVGFEVEIQRGGSTISVAIGFVEPTSSTTNPSLTLPPGSVGCIDFPSAGTQVYTVVLVASGGSTLAGVSNMYMVAYEL